jgi:hypothetical protein
MTTTPRQNDEDFLLSRKRRLSLENDFMNYSVDDILFGAMYYLATYHPEEKRLYLTKKNFTKNKETIKAVCGEISTQKLNRHLNKLIADNLVQEKDIKSGAETYPSYIFPYDYEEKYQLVENEMLWYIVSTRSQQAIKLYIYLLDKYLRTYNLNWFVNNVEPNLKIINPKRRYSFLELVKFYLENQLENNNTIFEVKIK